MIIVNGFQPLTIITKRSILVVAAALDPPLTNCQASLEAYLGSCQTSLMKFYAEVINNFQSLTIFTKKVYDICLAVS